MHVLVLQHVPHRPKVLDCWAKKSDRRIDYIDCTHAQSFPDALAYDAFIIMGGPMSVNDPLPWLAKEIDYIQHLSNLNKPILGICLGAQLIAKALGAGVSRMAESEIGWYSVQKTQQDHWAYQYLPERFLPMHWHSDSFELPKNAQLLYKSEACQNQAFAIGKHILGAQFHLDFDTCTTTRVAKLSAEQLLEPGGYIQQLDEMVACKKRFEAANQLLFNLLDGFCTGQ